MADKLTRQQIYDRIRSTSKDSYILEEMQRLGFWESSDVPTLSETLIKKEAALSQELNKLLEQNRKFQNQEAMLKEMRKERMKKAKEKRQLTKQKNKQKRAEKAEKWKQLQQQQIIYLGEGVSKGLNNTEHNTELLAKFNLPVFENVVTLAESMKMDLAALRYLLYQRKVSKTTHYHTFEIPKKSGGKRKISAPKRKLKNLQHWVLENILNKVHIDDAAHGFIKDKSIVTNAQPHIGQDIVINIDLKDFFPTITYNRVKGLFGKLGYSEQMSIIFALICTQSETEKVEMDGVTYYVNKNNRFLPQGSPASPAISNLIAYKLDKRIQGLCKKLGFTYTRYADDLSFSTTKDNAKNINRLLLFIKQVVETEGFSINKEKTHIMRKGGQQKVTGIVVNKKLNVERNQLRKFRALLHNIEQNGWANQKWGSSPHLISSVEGYINFIQMVNAGKAVKFREQLKRIVAKYGYPQVEQVVYTQPEKPFIEAPVQETVKDVPQDKPETKDNNDWWNIFS